MGLLIDQNKLQFDEKNNKTEKFEKNFNMIIINFKTIRYILIALGNIIHSMLIRKFMRIVSNLGLPKEQNQQIQEKIE